MSTMTIGSSYGSGNSMLSPYSDGGFEPATVTADNTTHPNHTHYIHTFTNTTIYDRSVREVTIDGLGVRVVFDINSMENLCVVPPGGTITIDFYRSYWPVTPWYANGSIDTTAFSSSSPIHYNGYPLPNASITDISPAYGGKSWTFRCYTETQSEIDALQAFVCPMEVGVSITGQQYVKSPIPSGTLFIKNLTTRAKVSYANCFIQSIDIEPMYLSSGLFGQWFNVTVVQSAYADA